MHFKGFSDDARLWAYGFAVRLAPDQAETVRTELTKFCDSWQVHGKPVDGSFELIDDQFALLAAADDVSGCSIDSSVAVFKDIKLKHGLDALDANLIFFRSKRGVEAVSRPEFQVLVAAGEIFDDTPVFNLTLRTVGEFNKGLFELPFKESWQAKAFKEMV